MKYLRITLTVFALLTLLLASACTGGGTDSGSGQQSGAQKLDSEESEILDISGAYPYELLLEEMQAFMDIPPDPDNEKLLTSEERAIIEDIDIYRNIIKVQLVPDSAQEHRKPIAGKMVEHFGRTARDLEVLYPVYYLELRVSLEVDGERSNFHIADARFENMSERVIVEEYAETRSTR